jgi:hypothetical protein
MLPYEPLIKIEHSKIKCYDHKTQNKVKTGEIHTYTSKQYVIPLKNDQPFSCDEEVTIIKSKDYFLMDKLLKQRKVEYDNYLEQNIALERDLKEIKEQLNYYKDMKANNKISQLQKIEKIEKEFPQIKLKYEKKYLDIEKQLKEKNKELLEAKREIKNKEDLIKELKEKNFLGKVKGILPKKGSSSKK